MFIKFCNDFYKNKILVPTSWQNPTISRIAQHDGRNAIRPERYKNEKLILPNELTTFVSRRVDLYR